MRKEAEITKLKRYKDALYSFYKQHGRMPSYAEAAKVFGLKSKDSAFKALGKLIALREVKKDSEGKLIPVSKASAAKTLPILGLVEAGFPTPAEETDLDRVSLDEWLIDDRPSSFMLRVKGDSMKDAGIRENDYVIVERTSQAKIGDIIIAEIDGAWTMKYLKKDAKGYFLEAANKAYRPIRPEGALTISAVVKAVVRKY